MRFVRRTSFCHFLLASLTLGLPSAVCAQAAPPQATPATTNATASVQLPLDPVAIDALKGMGNYLRSLKNFEMRSKATMQTTLQGTDLSIHLGYEGLYQVERPTRFHVEMKSDRAIREYFYDGKTFTVNVPRQKVYAAVPAPATIRATLDKVYLDYGISLPLADLFYWAEDPSTTGVKSAVRIGYAKINGQDTDQFAYRGDTLDWQLWIARGPAPLPLRMVVTDRSEKPQSSYIADLTWNTNPTFSAKTYTFTPAADETRIEAASTKEGL